MSLYSGPIHAWHCNAVDCAGDCHACVACGRPHCCRIRHEAATPICDACAADNDPGNGDELVDWDELVGDVGDQ